MSVEEKDNENVRAVLNLIGIGFMIASIVIAILSVTNVVPNFVLPIVAFGFIADAVILAFFDYSVGKLDKRRLIMQLFMYLLVFVIALVYLILSLSRS